MRNLYFGDTWSALTLVLVAGMIAFIPQVLTVEISRLMQMLGGAL